MRRRGLFVKFSSMQKMNTVNPSDWQHIGLWTQPIFAAYYWVHWYDAEIVKRLGFDGLWPDNLFISNGNFILEKKFLDELHSRVERVIEQEDETFLRNFIAESDLIAVQALEFAREHAAGEVTMENLQALYKKQEAVMTSWYINAFLTVFVEELVAEHAAHGGLTGEQALRFVKHRDNLVTAQHRDALIIKKELEQKGLLGAVHDDIQKIKDDISLWKHIEDHVAKFWWIGVANFIGAPWTIEEFLHTVVTMEESSIEESAVPQFSKKLQFVIELASDVAYLRQMSAETIAQYSCIIFPFLYRVADVLKVGYRDMVMLTLQEVMDALRDSSIDISDRIERRKKGYCIYLEQDGSEVIIDDPELIAQFEAKVLPVADHAAEIKGTVACPGVARGFAKIILTQDEFHKMNNGDILVTTMTTPEFVLLMQKSSAIVTDIGGLLSHAAIVSREMGKPCVIGTKFATKILKDGDLVEVDATTGIIKKLS